SPGLSVTNDSEGSIGRGQAVFVQAVNSYIAISVACPELVWVIRHNDTIGTCRVGRRRDHANKPRRLADHGIGLCIHDVDPLIVAVRQIVLLGYWIEPTDVVAASAIWRCRLGRNSRTVRVCYGCGRGNFRKTWDSRAARATERGNSNRSHAEIGCIVGVLICEN